MIFYLLSNLAPKYLKLDKLEKVLKAARNALTTDGNGLFVLNTLGETHMAQIYLVKANEALSPSDATGTHQAFTDIQLSRER